MPYNILLILSHEILKRYVLKIKISKINRFYCFVKDILKSNWFCQCVVMKNMMTLSTVLATVLIWIAGPAILPITVFAINANNNIVK